MVELPRFFAYAKKSRNDGQKTMTEMAEFYKIPKNSNSLQLKISKKFSIEFYEFYKIQIFTTLFLPEFFAL